MKLTLVRLYRDGQRGGFIVAADTVEEFSRKIEGLAGAVPDATWCAWPCPEGTDPAMASRKAL